MNDKKRISTLDYLRGLSALGIMIYHCLSWGYGNFSTDSFMGKWGVYGVSMFYILSGLTLYHVYFNSMIPSLKQVKEFFLKRFFRIFPLLWLTIILTVILSRSLPPKMSLFYNFTGLFGIFKWDGYIGTGVWSIGNELVFYLFFPVFILLTKRYKALFYVLSGILACSFLYFAFFKLDINQSLSNKEQWSMYVNPLNQVFLFLSGYMMGLYFTKYSFSKTQTTLIFILATLSFIFYVPMGENLGGGVNRIILSILTFMICFSFYKTTLLFPAVLDKIFTVLGEASYSIYLLHPIIWKVLPFILKHGFSIKLTTPMQIGLTFIFATAIGYFNYKYFETFFIKFGKKVSSMLDFKETITVKPG
ncbi:acyltransferase [Chitinophaga ginsengisegetis]|uniref:acyltransferase family protein n=1 Tax=Chitinophaga ginsengisegetis TaxID=393003 RepID=UPI0034211722